MWHPLLQLLLFTGVGTVFSEVTLKVCRVEHPTYAEEYRCVSDGDTAAPNYTWYKQDQSDVPKGVKAEGDTLHFLKWTPEMSGMYFCMATNQNGIKVASLYAYIQEREESFPDWVLNKIPGLWTLLKPPRGFTQSLQC